MFLPGESQGRGSLVGCVYGVAQSRTRLKRLSSSSSSVLGILTFFKWLFWREESELNVPLEISSMKVCLILDFSSFFGQQRSETSGGRLFFFTYLPRNLANIKCPSTQALSCCYKNRPQSGSISSCPAWFFSTPPPFFLPLCSSVGHL